MALVLFKYCLGFIFEINRDCKLTRFSQCLAEINTSKSLCASGYPWIGSVLRWQMMKVNLS